MGQRNGCRTFFQWRNQRLTKRIGWGGETSGNGTGWRFKFNNIGFVSFCIRTRNRPEEIPLITFFAAEKLNINRNSGSAYFGTDKVLRCGNIP